MLSSQEQVRFQGKEAGLPHGHAVFVEGGTSTISSKPLSAEVAVYDRVASSGSYPKLKVEIFPRPSQVGFKDPMFHRNPKPLELKRPETSNRESSRVPEARRRQLKYQMLFIVV